MVPRSETERLSTIGLRQKTNPMAREINALRVGLTAPLSSVLVRQLRQRLFRCSFPPQEATPRLTPALSKIRLQFSRQANQRHESMMLLYAWHFYLLKRLPEENTQSRLSSCHSCLTLFSQILQVINAHFSVTYVIGSYRLSGFYEKLLAQSF